MTRRTLSLLMLASASGCGSGRTISAAPPTPVAEPVAPSGPTAVAPPAPAGEPPVQVTPTPSGASSGTSSGAAADAYAPYGGQTLQIRRIGQWTASNVTTSERLVIRDDGAYERFWAKLSTDSRPAVDFTRDVVIAAAAGQRTTGGHAIAVERVTRTGDGMAVEVVETVPGSGCMTTQALTQPVDLVVVAASGVGTWSFSENTRERACP